MGLEELAEITRSTAAGAREDQANRRAAAKRVAAETPGGSS
ncbi:MAG: hypothetical protein R2704_08950 [Microthrixaceae bacterium]